MKTFVKFSQKKASLEETLKRKINASWFPFPELISYP